MLPVLFSILILLCQVLVLANHTQKQVVSECSYFIMTWEMILPVFKKKKKQKNTLMKTICLNYFFLLALHQVWDRGLHRIKWGFGKPPKNHKCYEQEATPSWIPCWSVKRRCCCVNGDCAFVSRLPTPEGHPTSLLCGGGRCAASLLWISTLTFGDGYLLIPGALVQKHIGCSSA